MCYSMNLSKYLSHWFTISFIIWLIAYSLKISIITRNFNPYYIALATFFGYLGVEGYMLVYKGYSFQPSFLMMKIITHLFPIATLWYLGFRDTKNAFRSLAIVVVLYVAYIKQSYENITDPYLKDLYPRKWSDLDRFCKNKDYPVCILRRLMIGVN